MLQLLAAASIQMFARHLHLQEYEYFWRCCLEKRVSGSRCFNHRSNMFFNICLQPSVWLSESLKVSGLFSWVLVSSDGDGQSFSEKLVNTSVYTVRRTREQGGGGSVMWRWWQRKNIDWSVCLCFTCTQNVVWGFSHILLVCCRSLCLEFFRQRKRFVFSRWLNTWNMDWSSDCVMLLMQLLSQEAPG